MRFVPGRSLNLCESKVRIIVELARRISVRARKFERFAYGLQNASRQAKQERNEKNFQLD